ncbi:roadblock/LC7 domain-containing protein [Embleya scabrispora]|uniref:roadblock/LC7 domain-containing protein n=1 Tax=Embleya scabrispora TaxID=159449 RepID=UPI0003782653|nr:roadblock/LC7 domain-containing protein [Embleya scabrispora]MYS82374.1 roadblock/LC7 domain-containing protein [Streptomyces sp. SID5474]
MSATAHGTDAQRIGTQRQPERDLDWLLENLIERTPGTRHSLVLSKDGLKLCRTAELTVDQADQLAAIASGIQSLSHGASIEFGDGSGGVRQSMTEFHGGILFIVEAGEGAHLAVIADDDADAGVVGHNMNELVEQIGEYLSTPAREFDEGGRSA